MTLLRFEQVALVRGGRLLFEGLDLALGAGRGAAGRPGPMARASRACCGWRPGLLSPSAGRVERSPLALADDKPALDRERPLADALRFWTGSDPADALAALGIAQLAEVPVRYLSSGQARRAGLARVVASGAPLWLLDEPLNALDADGAEPAGRGDRRSPFERRRGACREPRPAARRLGADRARRMIGRLIARDLRRSLAGAAWLPVAFFVLVAALVPFAIGPDAQLLARVGAGTLWIAALTAALMPIERLIEPDRADGTLDQLALPRRQRGGGGVGQDRRPLARLRAAAADRRASPPRHCSTSIRRRSGG